MSRETESSTTKIVVALITTLGIICAALIALYGATYQTEKPIQATQTAEARLAAPPKPTIIITVVQPYFSVNNKLIRPIAIYVDGSYKGEVDSDSTKSFVTDQFPVTVKWEIVKETTSGGVPIGDNMGGFFDGVSDRESITVDSRVAEQPYFYPIITNNSDVDCKVIINEGWASENDPPAIVPAHKENVGLGYYKLYSNSNVTLNCDDKFYWWGIRPNEEKGTAFNSKVDADNGTATFVLNP